jgi:hypothetical protein
MQEYPKALYRKSECARVNDAAEEEAQRAEGFTDWHTDHKAMQGDEGADDAAPTRDDLKAKAKELGIEHPANISTGKLADLVAAAKA